MPKLSNVTLKAMALTGNPANRRPIHAKKSATEDESMTPGHAEEKTAEALPAPSAEVLKALSEVQLTKAAGDVDHEAAAEAVGRLLAAHPSISHEDVLAVAKAVGLEAAVKRTAKKEEVDDEVDDEMDEDADEDESTDKKGKFKKGNPWAEKMKKSASDEGSSAVDEVLKSAASVEVRKAVEAMRKSYEDRIAKAERILGEERDYRVTNLIKSEVQGAFTHLSVDHDKLTGVIKHARESGNPQHAKDLMQVLKSAEAQVALAAKSGGSAFHPVGKSSQFGAASGGSAMAQIDAHIDAIVQKGDVKKTRPQLVDEFLMTAEGQALAIQHREERGF